MSKNLKIPRDKENDYTRDMARKRCDFIKEATGVEMKHVNSYSFEPDILRGNIENFIGVAQVPIGLAGPLLVNGEYAKGEFYVPLATSEGTLVASYNRGMKIIRECSGVKTTIQEEAMQRAPAFIFDDARQARDFGIWLKEHFDEIKAQAESTTRIGKLIAIEQYHAGRFVFTRFDYTTGDAAGQNMTGKATFFACEWIRQVHPNVNRYMIDGNLSTDKKHSQINVLRTRGKRVTAEIIIPEKIVRERMNQSPQRLQYYHQVSGIGTMMSGAANNGSHSANGITALFIACGQDVANVSEGAAAITYSERTIEGNYYFSVTIPAMIVATYGGGTGLATQQECLKMLGCAGTGNVKKFAEIVAGTVLAGELSLMSAMRVNINGTSDWIESHDKLGRNR
ncbi:MAG: hydroxymethylglutaryl-CoA reductase [Candidatus Heimdallarchaeota archaeon]|nr:hydroxymethylglutaryl-CoA reductase [Candidatus Heimdallarchaeota archaeon]